MSDIRTLLGAAEAAALAVETAKGGVEAARQRVEEAKAELEAAKGVVETAKGDLEAAYTACDEAGLPKAKAKRAVEAIIGVLAEAGVVTVASGEAAATPKPARKPRQPKRGEEAGTESETETTAEAQDGAGSGEADADAATADTAESGPLTIEIAPNHTLTVAAPTAAEIEAQSASAGEGEEGSTEGDLVVETGSAPVVEAEVVEPVSGEQAETVLTAEVADDGIDGETAPAAEASDEAISAEADAEPVTSGASYGVTLGDTVAVVDIDDAVEAPALSPADADVAPAADLPSGSVDLFDEPAAEEPATEAPAPTEAATAETVAEAPATPRPFGRPSFLNKGK